jgi:glycosyltransferase involved in cell wall biosynthesis
VKKNLIVVIGSLNVGGTERHIVRVTPKYALHGWLTEVLTLSEKGLLAADLEAEGVIVNPLLTSSDIKIIGKLPRLLGRWLRIFLCIWRLNKKFRLKKEVIVHFYLPESYVLGMIASALAQFSGHKIMSRRSLNFYQKKRLVLGWLEKKLHSKTSIIIGNSRAVLNELEKKEGVPSSQLRLIYNGIDVQPFMITKDPEEVRKSLGVDKNDLVIIIIANLIPYKGHADLLNALEKIKDKFIRKWHLVVVGRDDGIGESLKHLAKGLELSRYILWLGMRSDVPDLLKASDIGVLCSHQEGFSNAILEGMAAGLPMVVTDVGGNKEAVISGKTGYIVPSSDEKALANAILELANDPKKAQEFGEQGFLRVKEKFSLEASVKSYVELYDALFSA